MTLGKAVTLGLIAAAGVPLMVGRSPEWPWRLLAIEPLHVRTASFLWSWPIFCGVTLFAWLFLSWAGER